MLMNALKVSCYITGPLNTLGFRFSIIRPIHIVKELASHWEAQLCHSHLTYGRSIITGAKTITRGFFATGFSPPEYCIDWRMSRSRASENTSLLRTCRPQIVWWVMQAASIRQEPVCENGVFLRPSPEGTGPFFAPRAAWKCPRGKKWALCPRDGV